MGKHIGTTCSVDGKCPASLSGFGYVPALVSSGCLIVPLIRFQHAGSIRQGMYYALKLHSVRAFFDSGPSYVVGRGSMFCISTVLSGERSQITTKS
jgi:hypothetical protein